MVEVVKYVKINGSRAAGYMMLMKREFANSEKIKIK